VCGTKISPIGSDESTMIAPAQDSEMDVVQSHLFALAAQDSETDVVQSVSCACRSKFKSSSMNCMLLELEHDDRILAKVNDPHQRQSVPCFHCIHMNILRIEGGT
jgi:hypothetical protein